MRTRRPEALLYFPAVIIGGMVTLGGLAWLYERTRKKIEHPRLGTLTFYGDHWEALIPHIPGKLSVCWEVPGGRNGPDASELERFEAFWKRLPGILEQIRPRALEDLENCHDAAVGTRDEIQTRAILERVAAQASTFEQDWTLWTVAIHQGRHGERFWALEFEVSWDLEHKRTAYLEPDGKLIRYDLSCVVVDL